MNVAMLIYIAVLFVVLTPGVLVTLPPGGSKMVVILVHALLFALIYHLTHKIVYRMTLGMDGFESHTPETKPKTTTASGFKVY